MLAFKPPVADAPQVSAMMQYQQQWWQNITRLPPVPSRQRDAHEPLTYDEGEALRTWRMAANEVVERYIAYVATPKGLELLAGLEQSRQQALQAIESIDDIGNAGEFFAFLKATAHPEIAMLKAELRLLLAEFQRELAARPSDCDYIGAEAAYRKHYEQRAEAIKDVEAMLTTTYANHAEALEMIGEAKAAMAEVRKIPREPIYEVARSGYWSGTAEEFDAECGKALRRF